MNSARKMTMMFQGGAPADVTAPTVEITSTASGTTATAFTCTFTFSEDVTGFVLGDITVSANAGAGTFVAVSASVYTAVITPTAIGTVTVDVAAEVAQDAAGNKNTAATQFSIVNTTITSPAITPTLGSELVTDPGLEAAYVAGLCGTLNKTGSPTLAESADVHGGSKAQSFTATAQNDALNVAVTLANHSWYQASIWGKRTAGTKGTARWRFYNGATFIYAVGANRTFTDAAYAQKLMTLMSGGTGGLFDLVQDPGTVSGWDTVILDDYSVKLLSNTSVLLGTHAMDGIYTCKPTAATDTQVGLLVNYADANNYVMVILDRNVDQAKLLSRINGVNALKTSGAVTYGAAKELKVTVSGTTYKLYYDGAQVGTDQTIAQATMGTGVYGFSTSTGATVGVATATDP